MLTDVVQTQTQGACGSRVRGIVLSSRARVYLEIGLELELGFDVQGGVVDGTGAPMLNAAFGARKVGLQSASVVGLCKEDANEAY